MPDATLSPETRLGERIEARVGRRRVVGELICYRGSGTARRVVIKTDAGELTWVDYPAGGPPQ